jgi:hypothetical protein
MTKMNLTKRHKIFLAILGAGLAALLADRTILRPAGGPGAASADPAQTYAITENLPFQASGDALAPADRSHGTSLADRLASLVPQEEMVGPQGTSEALTGIRNPFLLPPSWFGGSDGADAPLPDVVARFVGTHQLAGVVKSGGERRVLVNDRFLVVGEVLDGFTLVSIEDHSAVFERDGMQAVLELLNR